MNTTVSQYVTHQCWHITCSEVTGMRLCLARLEIVSMSLRRSFWQPHRITGVVSQCVRISGCHCNNAMHNL